MGNGPAFDVPGPSLPTAIFEPLPDSMGSVVAEKRAIIKRQLECACGGRADCEHEHQEEIESGMEGAMIRESDDLMEARRRDESAERKLAEVQREKEEVSALKRAKEKLVKMAKSAELEDHPVYGPTARSRARGRGRPWINDSPERYV